MHRTLETRILKDYSDSRSAETVRKIRRSQQDGVGKVFDLEFADAIKGNVVSMKALHGRVVVVVFWSTSCGACIAEIPQMNELYSKYHEKGVEFIGVSLDAPKAEGGLERLKDCVEKNQNPLAAVSRRRSKRGEPLGHLGRLHDPHRFYRRHQRKGGLYSGARPTGQFDSGDVELDRQWHQELRS